MIPRACPPVKEHLLQGGYGFLSVWCKQERTDVPGESADAVLVRFALPAEVDKYQERHEGNHHYDGHAADG